MVARFQEGSHSVEVAKIVAILLLLVGSGYETTFSGLGVNDSEFYPSVVKRKLVLSGPNGRAVLTEMPLAANVQYEQMPWIEYGEGLVVLRAGTCARPGPGVGYHLPPGGHINYRYDTLSRSTFALETYAAAGAIRPRNCVEHRGRTDLRVTTARPEVFARSRTASGNVIVARAPGLEVILSSARGGNATRFKVLSDTGASGGEFGHLRRGTCERRPTSLEIPLRVIHPGIGIPKLERPVEVALPFTSFGQGRYVVEVHYANGGSRVTKCAQV